MVSSMRRGTPRRPASTMGVLGADHRIRYHRHASAAVRPAKPFDVNLEDVVRVAGVIVVIWIIVGLFAAGQRGYFGGSDGSCAKAGNTIITIIAGPLNYIGVNPKIECTVPQPTK
jgi:hypothetical protein